MHQVNADLLGWWLCERQLQSGGLNGRPEKVCMQTKVGNESRAEKGFLFSMRIGRISHNPTGELHRRVLF